MSDWISTPTTSFENYALRAPLDRFLANAANGAASAADLPAIIVKRTSSFSYCGPVLVGNGPNPGAPGPNSNADADAVREALRQWLDDTIHGAGDLAGRLLFFLAFANGYLAARGMGHYWFTIRAMEARPCGQEDYEMARWHTDESFFDTREEDAHGNSGWIGATASAGRAGAGARSASAGAGTGTRMGASSRAWASSLREKFSRTRRARQTDWKLCATLLGPSTLFIPEEHQPAARNTLGSVKKAVATEFAHKCTVTRCEGCAAAVLAAKVRLAEQLRPLGAVRTGDSASQDLRHEQEGAHKTDAHADGYEAPRKKTPALEYRKDAVRRQMRCDWRWATFFRTGSENGAVHSEPPMEGCDRVFVNLIPGTEEELRGLTGRLGMEFPRTWVT